MLSSPCQPAVQNHRLDTFGCMMLRPRLAAGKLIAPLKSMTAAEQRRRLPGRSLCRALDLRTPRQDWMDRYRHSNPEHRRPINLLGAGVSVSGTAANSKPAPMRE